MACEKIYFNLLTLDTKKAADPGRRTSQTIHSDYTYYLNTIRDFE